MLYFNNANEANINGKRIVKLNKCISNYPLGSTASGDKYISIKLWSIQEAPIINDYPTSNPFIPAYIFIEFVLKIVKQHMQK